MNTHIEHLLNEGGAKAPLLRPAQDDWRRRQEQRDRDRKMIKVLETVQNDLVWPVQRFESLHRNLSEEVLIIGLHFYPVDANCIVEDGYEPTPLIRALASAHEGHIALQAINDQWTYNQLKNLLINIQLDSIKGEPDFTVVEEEAITCLDGIHGEDQQILNVGWAHGTQWWPLICAITQLAVDKDLFDITMEYCRDYLIEGQDDRRDDDPEGMKAELLEDWNQPWYPQAMKELFKNKLDPSLVALYTELPKDMLDMLLPILKEIKTTSGVQDLVELTRHCEESFTDTTLHPVRWGRNSQSVEDEMDTFIDQHYSNGALVTHYIMHCVDTRGRIIVTDSAAEYEQRMRLRHTLSSWVNELAKRNKLQGF